MKLAYLLHTELDRETGVTKKLRGQATTWRGAGHEVRFFVLHAREADLRLLSPIEVTEQTLGGFGGRLKRVRRLADALLEWGPDAIYCRMFTWYPPLEKLLERFPTVMEQNTNDLVERRRTDVPLYYWYNRLTRGRLLSRLAGMVCVSHEIAEYYAEWRKPTVVIANGIELAAIPLGEPPNNPHPRLAMLVSADYPWNGLDKVIDLAAARPQWRIDVIGPVESALTGAPPNVVCHGHLVAEAYLPLLHQADAALGTLALHRRGMTEASALKTREYLAAGVPVINGYQDTDFMDGADFILQLSNEEDNVLPELVRIEAFLEHWRGRRVPRNAIAHLDILAKEVKRLAFIEQVCGTIS